MKANATLVLAGAGMVFAAPGQLASRGSTLLFKRTGYDLCDNDCKLAGVAFPDKHTLQLPLENNWSEQCPPIYIGSPNSPTASSRVCLDFVGPNIHFNFAPFPGHTFKTATVTWKLKGNALTPGTWSSPPPPATTVSCGPDPNGGDGRTCKLPFSDILALSPTTTTKGLLAGMCPNGDREGLVLYLQFSGEVQSTADSSAVLPFKQQPPCATRDAAGQCTSHKTEYSYIETVYRCSTCKVAACLPEVPPVTVPCSFGTAFGYVPDRSVELDTQPGQGCNRWGWYTTPTLAELQSGTGVGGPLYVGAGNNDISKATQVGTWSAVADATGQVRVGYLLVPPYGLDEVHVDLDCLPIDRCAPGSYTFGADGLAGVMTYTTGPIQYPACSGGSRAALIVHAAVDKLVAVGTTCPAPTN